MDPKTLPGFSTKYNFTSQKDNMRYNLACEHKGSSPFKDPFGQQTHNFKQPEKEVMELLTCGNEVWYINELEIQEKKRAKLVEEQMLLRKKIENQESKKLQAEDKSTEGGNQTSAPANDTKEKVEEDEEGTLDFIIDSITGKKMSRKRIKEMYQSGAFTAA